MTRGWDQWVWPLSMCERRRPANVGKVCHALALDDERHTFHPVLLDESTPDFVNPDQEGPVAHTDEERVTQVWFAGVHSNVGGGYPDDSLAHVPLLWMAAEAAKQQLRLHQHMIRLGLRARIQTGRPPTRDAVSGPTTATTRAASRNSPTIALRKCTCRAPKIHESVFHRIVLGLGRLRADRAARGVRLSSPSWA